MGIFDRFFNRKARQEEEKKQREQARAAYLLNNRTSISDEKIQNDSDDAIYDKIRYMFNSGLKKDASHSSSPDDLYIKEVDVGEYNIVQDELGNGNISKGNERFVLYKVSTSSSRANPRFNIQDENEFSNFNKTLKSVVKQMKIDAILEKSKQKENSNENERTKSKGYENEL